MRIVLLGAGRVGSVITRDLAVEDDFEVTVADVSQSALDRVQASCPVKSVKVDLANPKELQKLVEEHDIVVGAVPGQMGFLTFETAVASGKDVVDISFFANDPFQLDSLARQRDVTALVDCGLAPGLSNLILGHVSTLLDYTESFLCYVGGLPVRRSPPYEYKAPFCMSDVIEEYTRPVRFREQGNIVTVPALSDVELVDLPQIGTLEAFNTDGLRTLLTTMDTPDMKEKTLRYPGHADKVRILRDTGFFGREPLDVDGVEVRPIDVTSKLLFPLWQFEEGEEDLTVMRVIIEGVRDGGRVRYTFDLLDRYDRSTGTASMARTTGYTCAAIVRLAASGRYDSTGISPPEYLGRDAACYEYVMDELRRRGVTVQEEVVDVV